MPRKNGVKKAIKKGGLGLFGKAARGLMGRKARLRKAMGNSGKKRNG